MGFPITIIRVLFWGASCIGVFLFFLTIQSRFVCNLPDSAPKAVLEVALHLAALLFPFVVTGIWIAKGADALRWNPESPSGSALWFGLLTVSILTFFGFTATDLLNKLRGPSGPPEVAVKRTPDWFTHPPENRKPVPLARINCIHRINLVEARITLPDLDPEWRGLRIGHLTDFHFGKVCDRDYTRHCLDLIVERKPDLLALTGDFVNFQRYLDDCFTLMEGLSAPLGVFVVRGNHDYWTDPTRSNVTSYDSGLPFSMIEA